MRDLSKRRRHKSCPWWTSPTFSRSSHPLPDESPCHVQYNDARSESPATVHLALQARGEASIGGHATGAPEETVSFWLSSFCASGVPMTDLCVCPAWEREMCLLVVLVVLSVLDLCKPPTMRTMRTRASSSGFFGRRHYCNRTTKPNTSGYYRIFIA